MKNYMKFHKKYEKKGADRKDTFNTPFASVSRHLVKLTCACHSCLTQETMTVMTGHLKAGGGGTFLSVDCQESPLPPLRHFLNPSGCVAPGNAMRLQAQGGKRPRKEIRENLLAIS
jgi:hypothetical protein